MYMKVLLKFRHTIYTLQCQNMYHGAIILVVPRRVHERLIADVGIFIHQDVVFRLP